MMNQSHKEFKLVLSMVILATLSRIAPTFFSHLPNFSALNAIALFSGTYFHRRVTAIVVVFFSVGLSDFFIHEFWVGEWNFFYPGFYWQYISYALIAVIGISLKNRLTLYHLLFAGLTASCLFFIMTNLGTWLCGYLYPMTFGGLITCFINAIPFFKNTLMGDLVFISILFGSLEVLSPIYLSLRNAFMRSPAPF